MLASTLGSSLTTDLVLWLRLFSNDYTPGAASVTGDFVQPTFAGYAPIQVNRSDWQVPVIVSGKAQSLLFTGPAVWTTTDPTATVYGAYVVGQSTGVTWFAERFASPVIVTPTDPIRYRVAFTGRGEV